jgi:hypothetical protein
MLQFYYNITHALCPFLRRVLQEPSCGKENALCSSAQIKGKNFRILSLQLAKSYRTKINPHFCKLSFFDRSTAEDVGTHLLTKNTSFVFQHRSYAICSRQCGTETDFPPCSFTYYVRDAQYGHFEPNKMSVLVSYITP